MVPYDKDEYRDLIEHKGGEVVDTVGKEDRNKKDKIFLISDNYARTVKYIYCLAACIPCVSHKWVQECILQVSKVTLHSAIENFCFKKIIIHLILYVRAKLSLGSSIS